MLVVRFKDQEEYLFVGADLDRGGALASSADYQAGRCSFAYLFPDGRVLRFGEIIGSRADLKVVGQREVGVDPMGILRGLLFDPSWPSNKAHATLHPTSPETKDGTPNLLFPLQPDLPPSTEYARSGTTVTMGDAPSRAC